MDISFVNIFLDRFTFGSLDIAVYESHETTYIGDLGTEGPSDQ
jgi:hypothetical protein